MVVIAILGILASILLPALKKTYIYTEINTCKNTMRHFFIADELYADDNNELYVSIKANPWKYTWAINKSYLSYLESNESNVRYDMNLRCPALEEPSYGGWSYAPNWSNDKFGWWEFSNQSLVRNRIGSPSKKMKMVENTDWHALSWQANPNRWNNNKENIHNAVAYRHDYSAVLIFADGHLERRIPERLYFNGVWNDINDFWRFSGESFSDH